VGEEVRRAGGKEAVGGEADGTEAVVRLFTVRLLVVRLSSVRPLTPLLLTAHFLLLSDGADRDRTGDPLLAKQVLSQLSYRPEGLAS
jgi:hypothetical protein